MDSFEIDFDALGPNLKLYREALGLTQDVVAQHLGIVREELSYYETSKRKPTIKLVEELAALYGVTLKELFGPAPSVHIQRAFRADKLDVEDLKGIKALHRMAANYSRMLKLKEQKAAGHDAN